MNKEMTLRQAEELVNQAAAILRPYAEDDWRIKKIVMDLQYLRETITIQWAFPVDLPEELPDDGGFRAHRRLFVTLEL